MKRLVFVLLILTSCGPNATITAEEANEAVTSSHIHGIGQDQFYVITVDNCEYVVYSGSNKGDIIHKANCKNHK